MSLKMVVVYGSVRQNRQGIKGARFLVNQLEARGHEVSLVDAKEANLPLLDKMYKEYEAGQAPENMERIAEAFRQADGFVFVSGEYNHSLPPALKNLIDHFMNEYFWRPAGIACYSAGPFGGVRAAVHLRAVLSEVGLVTTPSLFPMSRIHKSFDEAGKALEASYERRVQKFLDELEWYAQALKAQRDKGGMPYT